jgi:hypothetical protein
MKNGEMASPDEQGLSAIAGHSPIHQILFILSNTSFPTRRSWRLGG